jgi:hypothetical protein
MNAQSLFKTDSKVKYKGSALLLIT